MPDTTLRLFGKKRFIVNSLNALQLEIAFCSAGGTLTQQQRTRIRKKAKQYVRIMYYFKKRYSLTNKANFIGTIYNA